MYRDSIGTPLLNRPTKILLLGAGELGKEIVIEAQRLGAETITVDRYDQPPASHVAHRHYTVNMLNGEALKAIVRREKPDVIVPEIEAINTDALVELEEEGFTIGPTAKATKATMDRFLIRRLASMEAGVQTSRYAFADGYDELLDACEKIGYPCVAKAKMSSGGLGSTLIHEAHDVKKALENAQSKARVPTTEIIVEEIVQFDFEVTELVLAHLEDNEDTKLSFLKPVGHIRFGSHYHVSWQPFIAVDASTGFSERLNVFGGKLHMDEESRTEPPPWCSPWNGKQLSAEIVEGIERKIYETARKVVGKLLETDGGIQGRGIFGCELFVKLNDEDATVYFNEVSPRPHDTGMVTFVSQDLSEAALHVRAVLGLPIPKITLLTPASTHVVLSHEANAWTPRFYGVSEALRIPGVHLRLFGKPCGEVERRLALALAIDSSVETARVKAMRAAHILEEAIQYG